MNLMAASFSQPGSPAMADDFSAHSGMGTIGLKGRVAPCSRCSWITSPFSLCGEWQSPHMPTCSTKYLPRATEAAEALLGFVPASAGTSARLATAAATIILRMKIPQLWNVIKIREILHSPRTSVESTVTQPAEMLMWGQPPSAVRSREARQLFHHEGVPCFHQRGEGSRAEIPQTRSQPFAQPAPLCKLPSR